MMVLALGLGASVQVPERWPDHTLEDIAYAALVDRDLVFEGRVQSVTLERRVRDSHCQVVSELVVEPMTTILGEVPDDSVTVHCWRVPGYWGQDPRFADCHAAWHDSDEDPAPRRGEVGLFFLDAPEQGLPRCIRRMSLGYVRRMGTETSGGFLGFPERYPYDAFKELLQSLSSLGGLPHRLRHASSVHQARLVGVQGGYTFAVDQTFSGAPADSLRLHLHRPRFVLPYEMDRITGRGVLQDIRIGDTLLVVVTGSPGDELTIRSCVVYAFDPGTRRVRIDAFGASGRGADGRPLRSWVGLDSLLTSPR